MANKKFKPTMQIGISVEERNELTKKHYHAIVSKPSFKIGQKVVANELGLQVKILDEGQFAIVTRADDQKLVEETGNPSQTMEIQLFNRESHLIRMAVDPRFFKVEKGEK